jgi:hypothetical protein
MATTAVLSFAAVGWALPVSVGAQEKSLTVSLGRLPWGALNSPITQHMMKTRGFETEAARHGYRITLDWRDYPSAPHQV